MIIAFLDSFFSALIAIVGILSLFVLDLAFCVWATIMANRGTAWNYPFVPNFI